MRQKQQGLLLGFSKPVLALLSVVVLLAGMAISFAYEPREAAAATNEAINFQARLMNASGAIAPDGYYNVEFKLYDVVSGGTALWTDTYIDTNGTTAGNDNRIRVENGYLTVSLGSQAGNGFPSTINWDEQLWITMNIGGTTQTATPTWDGEMSPRLRLTAVPYAFRAKQLASTNGTNTGVLELASMGQDTVITLPDPGAGTATVCYQGSTGCGFVAGTAANFIQNTTSQQASSNFWISGTGKADTALQAPTIDAPTATTLNIGASGSPTATSISLNQNTAVAAGKTLTVSGGATSLTGASTGDALTVSNSTSTGNVAVFKDNATAVFTIANGGGSTFTTTVDTSSALRVVNASGGQVMSVSTAGGTPLVLGYAGVVGNIGSVLSDVYQDVSTTSRPFTYTGTVNAGQSVVGTLVLSAPATTSVTITDSKSNTYTVDASVSNGSNVATYVFSSNITTGIVPGDTMTVTIGSGTGRWLISAQGFGNLLTPAVDQSATNTGTNTAMTVGPTGTTTAADELVFAAFGFNSGRTFAPGTANGFTGVPQISTSAGSNDRSLGAEWKYVSSAGAQSANASISVSGAYASVLVTYKSTDPDLLGLAGAISLSDGGPNGYSAVLGTNSLNGSRTLLLPDESGTLCVQGSANCGFVSGTSANFIQNGTTVQTDANFNIRSAATGSVGAVIQGANGQTADLLQLQTYNGTTSTNVFAVSAAGVVTLAGGQTIDVTTASAATANGLTLQPGISTAATTTGGGLTLRGGEVNGAGGTVTGGTVTIQGGNATGGSGTQNGGAVTIDGGTGATAAGAINIGTANAPTINIGSVGTTAKATAINIGTSTTTTAGMTQTVTIGSAANLGHTVIVQGGNSNTQAIQLLTHTSGGIMIGSSTSTGTITLGRSTASNTVSIGSANPAASATQTVNIGNGTLANASSAIAVNILSGAAGSNGTATLSLANNDRVTQVDIGNVVADAARTLNVFTGNSTTVDTINIGTGATTAAGGKTINIGNGTPTGSGTNVVSIGSTTNASTTTVNGGTGSGAVSIQAGTSGTISVGTANANTVNVGGTNASTTATIQGGGGVNIGTGGTTGGVQIGNTTGGVAQTINIGTNATASATNTVNIGAASTSSSVVTINGGTGAGNDITLQTNNASSGVLIKSATNSTSAFAVRDASNNMFFGADTSAGTVAVGYASSTSTLNGTVKLATLGAATANAVAVCRDSSTTNLIACDANASGAPFLQGGNSFGAAAVLGTNDTQNLQFETNNVVRATFDQSNGLYLGLGVTNAAPTAFTLATTGSSAAGAAGAALTIQGGAGASATTGSAGGAVTVKGGNAGGTGDNAGGNVLLQGGTGTGAGAVGAVIVRAQTNGSGSFMVQNSSSSSMFIADTQNGRVGINLGGTTAPASTLEVGGTIRLSGSTTENFTTPGSSTTPTKINIPVYDPGALGQILAFGLGSGANSTARAIALYDGRTSAHMPTIAVLSPNEAQTFGLSWEGSNANSYLKTSGTGLILQASNADIITATTTGTSVGTNLSVFGNMSATGTGSFGASGNYGIVTMLMQSQDNYSSGLRVQKRGNAADINGAVASGAEIGYHEFYGWNGSAFGRGAYVITRATEAWNGTSNGASYAIATTRNGTTANTEVMTLGHNGAAVFKNSADSSTAFQVQNALTTNPIFNVDTTSGRIGINTSAPTADLSFGEAADHTINVITRASNAAGRALTIQGGAGGAGASANQGGALNLQGGAGGGTNGNGGNVNISGGAGTGTGVRGLVVIDTPTVSTTATDANCGATTATNCTIAAATVNNTSSVVVGASATGVTITMPDPTITTAGRIFYFTAANGSQDFALALNSGGTLITISMRANSTATLIWNGSDWTAAGASSSTTLQSAYDSTLTSAGGAEIVLNNTASSNGLTIRNNASSPIIGGGLFEVQSSIGTNLFSVNNNISELAANGGAEDSSTFSTNWTSLTGTGNTVTPTVARTTTAGQFTTGQAGVSVTTDINGTGTTVGNGVRNNLATNPATSTTYMISFTAKLASGTFTDLRVDYTPTGATTGQQCIINQTIVTGSWTRITCEVTTPATGVTNPDILIYQASETAAARTFYIDNLSMTLADDSGGIPNNVQIGGGINGGAPTLFTLDRSSAPPVANGNTTYYGSMYYDTTTGRIQCYEADGWGACGSSPDNIITLTPEYTGAVLAGPGTVGGVTTPTGVGTMTADFCANQSGTIVVGTLCASGEARNFYKWTSPQPTQQVYSIYVTYKLPSTFKNFANDNTITLTAQRSDSNATVSYEVYKSTGGAITACGSETTVTTSDDVWQTVPINGNENTTCAFAEGNYVIFKINVKAHTNANAYVENLNFTFTNN